MDNNHYEMEDSTELRPGKPWVLLGASRRRSAGIVQRQVIVKHSGARAQTSVYTMPAVVTALALALALAVLVASK